MQKVSTSPFQTDDMGLVTYLRLNGHDPIGDPSFVNNICQWQFEHSEELNRAVEKFQLNTAKVSPKEYSKAFKRTRGEFYDARDRLRNR